MNHFSKLLSNHVNAHSRGITNLASKTGMSRPSIYDAIKGKSLPKEGNLERIIDALDLPLKAADEIKKLYQLENSLSTRNKREEFHRSKKTFIQMTGTHLLAKGLEISYGSSQDDSDIVIRSGKSLFPVIASTVIHDYPTVLGLLLSAMFKLNANKGFVCLPKVTPFDRSQTPIFEKYSIKILGYKSVPRIILCD